jgi:Spy/CpxP family protein refolding chaperone
MFCKKKERRSQVRIDEVLTKEQRAEFQKASKEQRGKKGKKKQ